MPRGERRGRQRGKSPRARWLLATVCTSVSLDAVQYVGSRVIYISACYRNECRYCHPSSTTFTFRKTGFRCAAVRTPSIKTCSWYCFTGRRSRGTLYTTGVPAFLLLVRITAVSQSGESKGLISSAQNPSRNNTPQRNEYDVFPVRNRCKPSTTRDKTRGIPHLDPEE